MDEYFQIMNDLPESDLNLLSLVLSSDGGILLSDVENEYRELYKSQLDLRGCANAREFIQRFFSEHLTLQGWGGNKDFMSNIWLKLKLLGFLQF